MGICTGFPLMKPQGGRGHRSCDGGAQKRHDVVFTGQKSRRGPGAREMCGSPSKRVAGLRSTEQSVKTKKEGGRTPWSRWQRNIHKDGGGRKNKEKGSYHEWPVAIPAGSRSKRHLSVERRKNCKAKSLRTLSVVRYYMVQRTGSVRRRRTRL